MDSLTIGQKFLQGITKTGVVEEVFNMLLVLEGIRKSCLIQPVDAQYNDGKTLKRVLKLADLFNLKKVKCDQGFLLMKYSTKVPFNLNSYCQEEFGEFLSFPYAGDIVDKRNYRYAIMLELFNTVYEPVAMVSSGGRSRKVRNFEKGVEKMVTKLNAESSLKHAPIKVWSVYKKIYSIEELIECVQVEGNMNNSINSAIESLFCNYGLEYNKDDSKETVLKKINKCKIFFKV